MVLDIDQDDGNYFYIGSGSLSGLLFDSTFYISFVDWI